MENPRPEKVAVVEEVREKLSQTEAVVFTEYRGLTVRDLQDLRGALAEAGGEYKVYKNTLVRRATAELDLDLGETLTGPTALALVADRPDGTPGDAVLVAKALKVFAKGNPNLVVKGGRLGELMLDTEAVMALADVAPTRGVAGTSGGWHGRSDDQHGTAAAGGTPEDGLRAVRTHRERWSSGCSGIRRG